MGIQKYVNRLKDEWEKHKMISLGVDFDNTIAPYHRFDNNDDIEKAIELILKAQERGCYIVIHTASPADRHDHIREFCENIGIRINTINLTPEEVKVPFGRIGSKPYCNLFLDDRAGLNEALDILDLAMIQLEEKEDREAGRLVDLSDNKKFSIDYFSIGDRVVLKSKTIFAEFIPLGSTGIIKSIGDDKTFGPVAWIEYNDGNEMYDGGYAYFIQLKKVEDGHKESDS